MAILTMKFLHAAALITWVGCATKGFALPVNHAECNKSANSPLESSSNSISDKTASTVAATTPYPFSHRAKPTASVEKVPKFVSQPSSAVHDFDFPQKSTSYNSASDDAAGAISPAPRNCHDTDSKFNLRSFYENKEIENRGINDWWHHQTVSGKPLDHATPRVVNAFTTPNHSPPRKRNIKSNEAVASGTGKGIEARFGSIGANIIKEGIRKGMKREVAEAMDHAIPRKLASLPPPYRIGVAINRLDTLPNFSKGAVKRDFLDLLATHKRDDVLEARRAAGAFASLASAIGKAFHKREILDLLSARGYYDEEGGLTARNNFFDMLSAVDRTYVPQPPRSHPHSSVPSPSAAT